jgi:hypothetical protein
MASFGCVAQKAASAAQQYYDVWLFLFMFLQDFTTETELLFLKTTLEAVLRQN